MKKKVAIVTDSTACLPDDIARRYGITIVPIWIFFGEQALRDGMDISASEFYDRLREADTLPKTSSPSPDDYLNVYERL